jgi:hypothetical protein
MAEYGGKGYSTPELVAGYLNSTITPGTAEYLATITAIMRAEELIDIHCSREFVVTKKTIKLDGKGKRSILVPDLLNVSELIIGTLTVSSSSYSLYPYDKFPKTKLFVTDGYVFNRAFQNVTITGLFGYQKALPTMGTATGGSNKTLVHSTLTQDNAYWASWVLSITEGTNVNEHRYITSSFKDTTTIGFNEMPLAIDTTSKFAIGRIPIVVRLATTRLAGILLRTRSGLSNAPIISESQGDYSVTYDYSQPMFSIDRETALMLASVVKLSFGGGQRDDD